jgi:hypothetical protein
MDTRKHGPDDVPRDAASELRAAIARFDALVEQSISGIYVIQDGRFAYVNPRMARSKASGSRTWSPPRTAPRSPRTSPSGSRAG